MKVLLCPMGSAGDVFPFLGLGERFKYLGHEVTLYTSDYFALHAQRFGFRFERLGPQGIYENSIKHPDLWHPRRSFPYLYDTMCRPSLDEQYDFVTQWCRDKDAVALINCFGFGALCAQESTGGNIFSVHLQPTVLASYADPPALPHMPGPRFVRRTLMWLGGKLAVDPVVCPTLNEFRRQRGLPPIRDVLHWWSSKRFNIMLFPDWFAPPASDWPQPLYQGSFPLWEANYIDDLPEHVQEFLDGSEPVIALTAGSANLFSKKFFTLATAACQRLGARPLYLSAGHDQIPDVAPENALVCPFVSLRKLLPKCAAMANHGGIGTVSQAMAAGIPQLVVPIAHDQFDNGERIQKLGLGGSLAASKLTVNRIAHSFKTFLSDEKMLSTCHRFSQKLDGDHAIAAAVDSIVQASSANFGKGNSLKT